MSSTSITKTTCPYCGVGCGIEVTFDNHQFSVRGDPTHPANQGRICSKGAALIETIDLRDRLLYPEVDGKRESWEVAIEKTAAKFQQIIDQYGPDAVAFYVSGQLLTEDYYVANKLMKGFIGSGNIDTNSRLCMASAVAGHKRAFGEDIVPGSYEDLELTELILIVGSNTAWCHPVIFQRISAAKKSNDKLKIVVIDPRKTATTEIADLHLAIKPGSDAFLFNGLLNYLRKEDFLDWHFIETQTEDFAATIAGDQVRRCNVAYVSEQTGIDGGKLVELYRLFARTKNVVTLFSQGINQSSSGTDKVNAIINCHLATGKIGRPGATPFSITGQPNAMGGREVGGLANSLAAHLEFDIPGHREILMRFWESDRIAARPGLKAVDLFDAILDNKIKAVWIMATNPVVSMPDSNKVSRALSQCEFVVVSDCVRNSDTVQFADVLFPALTWGEKDGTVTNSERCISRQRAFLPPPGESKADWWIISQVAKKMGFANSFDYQQATEIFREHASLSGFENNGARGFDISYFSQIDTNEYNSFSPVQWPVTSRSPEGTARLFSSGNFYRSSHKAKFVELDAKAPANLPSSDFPLVLNTGRVRDHWHTMTRTGKASRLTAHTSEPFVQIHPTDAQRFNLQNKQLCKVSTELGNFVGRVVTSVEQQCGTVFSPIHWNNQFASKASVNALVASVVDPISGQPELKQTPVTIQSIPIDWNGFVMSQSEIRVDCFSYWSKRVGDGFFQYEIAGENNISDFISWMKSLSNEQGEWIEFVDKSAFRFRAALIHEGTLRTVVFIGSGDEQFSRDWVASLFRVSSLTPDMRLSLLSGKPPKGRVDEGPIVCACFQIGRNKITDVIRYQHANTPEMVGRLCNAGTNCGACLPEIKKLISS